MRAGDTIYMDYQASTPLDPSVLAVMEEAWRQDFANPHAADHVLGWRALASIESAAESIGAHLGVGGDHVVFTSGATEANWLAIFGNVHSNRTETDRIVISAAEHKSVQTAAESVARQAGIELLILGVDPAGRVEAQQLHDAVKGRRAFVSIIAVGNEAGAISDLALLREACGEASLFHIDASQALAAVDPEALAPHADLITLSSHKLYGPKGVGALIAAPDLRGLMKPLMPGGSQQGGLRPGTVPGPLIAGFSAAMSTMAKGPEERARIAALRDRFISGLDARIGGVCLVGDRVRRHPGNACVRVEGVDASDLLSALQPRIAASTQSACASGTLEPSPVLLAMGLPYEAARECIRFSFGRFSDASQIEEAIEVIAQAANDRRQSQSRIAG
jgi:cysteine desulfurase